jgi:hypothetical protein
MFDRAAFARNYPADGHACLLVAAAEGGYLDPVVRPGMSALAQPGDAALAPGLRRLEADLASGAWHDRHRDLLDRDTLDGGYRLLIADL